MENNQLDIQKDKEIDLLMLFKFLMDSKKIIITLSLTITILGSILGFMQKPEFKSTAIIKGGNYSLCTGITKSYFITQCSSSTKHIINLPEEIALFNYMNETMDINEIEFRRVNNDYEIYEISVKAPSSELAENYLNSLMQHVQKVHNEYVDDILNRKQKRLNREIALMESQIDFILSEQEERTLEMNELVLEIVKDLETIANHNLNKEILLTTKIKSNKDLINNILDDNKFEIFEISNDIKDLQYELSQTKSLKIDKTKLIGDLNTIDSNTRVEIFTLLSFIFGLFFSIATVLFLRYIKYVKSVIG